MQMLQGWQKQASPGTAVCVRRIAVGLLLACLLATFGSLLRWPYQRPTCYIAILTPKEIATKIDAATVPVTARNFIADQLDVDLASLLCQSNGRHIEKSVRAGMPQSLLAIDGHQLKQQSQVLPAAAGQALNMQSTLVLYLSGVLSIENRQPSVCDLAHDATHGGGELMLLPFVQELQRIQCGQILLCIDLVPPHHAAPAVLASPLIVDELTESLEQVLSKHSLFTPIAVCAQLHSVDEVVANGRTETPLAIALADALRAEASHGTFDVHRVKNRLSGISTSPSRYASASDRICLTSINWPTSSAPVRLPRVPDAVTQPPASAANPQASPSIDWDVTSGENIDVEELSDAQLWRAGKLAIKRFDRVEGLTPHEIAQASTDWLPMPDELSYRQRHPFAVAWFEHLWYELEAAASLSDQAVDSQKLRSIVRTMINLTSSDTRSRENAAQRSTGPQASKDVEFTATNSLIVNASIVGLDSRQRAVAVQSRGHLQQLTQLIDQSLSAVECKAGIEKLAATQPRQVLEFERCRSLCEVSLPWSSVQRLLRMHMLALRSRVELFQDAPGVPPLLDVADRLAQTIRAEVDLRPDNHSNTQLDLLIDRASGLYRLAINHMTDQTHAGNVAREAVCRMLSDHAWTRLTGKSSRASTQALQTFTLAWQELFGDQSLAGERQVAVDSSHDIAQMVEQTQRLIGDASSTRYQQIDAILHLNRQVIASAEAKLVEAMQTNPLSVTDRKNVEPGAIRYFLRLISSHRTQPAHAWIDDRLIGVVKGNIQRTHTQLQGATLFEQAELESWLKVWEQLAHSLRSHGIDIPCDRTDDWQLSVRAPAIVDLQRTESCTIPCTITYESTANATPSIQTRYDTDALVVRLQDRLSSENAQMQSDEHRTSFSAQAMDSPTESSSLGRRQFVLSVQRIANRPVKEPIVLLVSHGDTKRRAVIHVETTQAPLVELHLFSDTDDAEIDHTEIGQGGMAERRCVLLPNRQQRLALHLSNRRSETLKVDSRVWAVSTAELDMPTGTLSKEVAQDWFSRHPSLVPLAQATSLLLDPESSQHVVLMPLPLTPDLKQQSLACTGLLISITDLQSQRTQIEYWPLHVRHPRDYAQQDLLWNAQRQTLEVECSLREAKERAGQPAVALTHRLLEWPTLKELAQAGGTLAQDHRSQRWELTAGRSRAERLVLMTEVDGWPATWGSVIDRRQNALSNEPWAKVTLSSALRDGVVPASDDEIHFHSSLCSNQSLNDKQAQLFVGWDRNHDRTLIGEPAEPIPCAPAIQAGYAGVDALGSLLLDTRVASQKIRLSMAGLTNERVSVLAVLRQGDHVLAQAELPIIRDRQSPRVLKTHIEHADRCLAGEPLVAKVEVDDFGLSGVVKVEGAWSLNGQMAFGQEVQPFPGSVGADGSWTLTLPTAGLSPGEHALIVRAQDAAGNWSETYRTSLRLRSLKELTELADNARSIVTGWLTFAKVPQSGLKVELLKVEDQTQASTKSGESSQSGSPTAKSEKAAAELSVVATTTSAADGSFRWDDIRSGSYRVRVSGIVRGMRVEQFQDLTVEAPKLVAPLMWRLDKQP